MTQVVLCILGAIVIVVVVLLINAIRIVPEYSAWWFSVWDT